MRHHNGLIYLGIKEINPVLEVELKYDLGLNHEWKLNRLLTRLYEHHGNFRMRPSVARWLSQCYRYPFLRDRVKAIESLLEGRDVAIIEE